MLNCKQISKDELKLVNINIVIILFKKLLLYYSRNFLNIMIV